MPRSIAIRSAPSGLIRRLRGRGRWPLLLAAIAALLWQSSVTQTHIHPLYDGTAQLSASAGAANGHAGDADCPICREIVQAGAYLTPDAPIVVAAAPAAPFFAVAAIRAMRFARFAPAWRSRAPPVRAPG